MKAISLVIPLTLLGLLFLNACTHAYYKDPKSCAEMSYWSTKDQKGLLVEMDGIKISVEGSENQATELVKEAVGALMLKKKKEKRVMEALTGE